MIENSSRFFDRVAGGLHLIFHLSYSTLLFLLGLLWNSLKPSKHRTSHYQILGDLLVRLMPALGPTYVKLGQILAARRDLLPAPLVQELKRLQDRLPPAPFPTVSTLFRKELGVDLGDVFADFEQSPIASGSIATVYRARLRSGLTVAVKVRRPGVSGAVRRDLAFLAWLARALDRLCFFPSIPFPDLVNEFGICIRRQLDFRLEAEANKRLHLGLTWEEGIILPKLIDQLCSFSLLTMQFIPLFSEQSEIEPTATRDGLLVALRGLYRMIFVEGFVHCDLHAGNIAFTSDGRAAMIDFGFMAELTRSDRLTFAEFFLAMAFNDGARCAEIILRSAAYVQSDLRRNVFVVEVVALVNEVSSRNTREFNLATFVVHLFAIQKRHRIIGTTAFTMAIISLLVWEGLAKDVNAQIDFKREAHPYLFRASIMPSRSEMIALR